MPLNIVEGVISRFRFCKRSWRPKINIRRSLCFFGSRTFVLISWMCKKQTSVSHSSTESEILSLDAGFLPALALWDLIIEVLRTTHGIPKPTQASTRETGVEIQSTPKIKQVLDQNVDPSKVDQVPSIAHLSEKESQLCIFEDNEAVIKMIIKGRSPTMTRVPHPPSCSLTEWSWTRRFKQSTSNPKTNSQTWSSANFVTPWENCKGWMEIDFEWKIFRGATALDLGHEIQADLQGKHVTPENVSVIEWSSCPFSTTLKWKRTEMKILVLLLQGRSKSMPLNSTMDTGHSWDQEKKASGINDIQPIIVANVIFVLHRWWKTSKIQDTRHSRKWVRWAEGLRDTIHFNGEYCNVDLLCRTVHSTNPEQSQSGMETCLEQILEEQVRATCSQNTREIQIKQENLKSFVATTLMSKIEYLRTTAKFCCPVKEGNCEITTTLEDDGWRRSKSTNQEIGPVLNIWIATIVDVPGIEVQVPSLRTPGRSLWILTLRGHERFVNEIHRHNSEIVNHSSSLRTKEENFDIVGFESSKPAVEKFEQCDNEGWIFWRPSGNVASTMRETPASSKSSRGSRSNPMSIHPRTKSIYTKKEIHQRGQCANSQSSRKRDATSLDQSCPRTSRARHAWLCSYTSQRGVHSPSVQTSTSLLQPGLFGQPYRLQSQEQCHWTRRWLLRQSRKPTNAQAFNLSALTQGLNSTAYV